MNDDCGGLCETDWYQEYEKARNENFRLRSLAARVRKIEWECHDSIFKGNPLRCYAGKAINGFSFYVKWYLDVLTFEIVFKGKAIFTQSGFEDSDAAKAACQSAFEAWVWQFVEVGE